MYELFVSLRYLMSRRRQGFISLITVISVGGVAVGVMVLIVVLSVMSGFETTLKERLLGINAHLWVLPQRAGQLQGYRELATRVETIPRVTHATPFTAHEVMLMAGGRVAGTIVRGIDPEERTQTADFARLFEGQDLKALLHPLENGAVADGDGRPQSAGRGIVLGEELASTLRVTPADQVILNSPMGILQPAGILPECTRFYGDRDVRDRHVRIRCQIGLDFPGRGAGVVRSWGNGTRHRGAGGRHLPCARGGGGNRILAGSGCVDARLDADEPDAVCGASAGARADVHHPGPDHPSWPHSISSAR